MSRLGGLTEEQYQSAHARAVARRVGAARNDPAECFGFVMREETTRRAIRVLPHQQLLFAFVMAHERSVVRMPVGASKTYCMSGLTMWLLGQDPTARGAVISSTQLQAQKPVGMVRDYIETSPELRLVFPDLRRSQREKDWWTQIRLVVDRPPGIRDASLTAVGVDGALPGSRLSWLLVDDILDPENTSTPQARAKVRSWFNKVVLSRKDIVGAKVVVTNTPYNPDDLTFALERSGWPTITMDIEGTIRISNADDFVETCGLLRVSDLSEEAGVDVELRLADHDSRTYVDLGYPASDPPDAERDVEDKVPLWPEKFGRAEVEQLRAEFPTVDFNQLFMCVCRDDEGGRVKGAWIEAAKKAGRELRIHKFAAKMPNDLEGCPAFTGVDLGVSKRKKSHRSSIFTFGLQRDRRRRILRVDAGKWSGQEIIDRVRKHHDDFASIIRVETNAAQDFLRQWALAQDIGLPIRAHTTGKNKRDSRFGVESVFVEIENGAWVFPCDPTGHVPESLAILVGDLLYYDPDTHTGDVLMAMWLAREQARSSGALARDYQFGEAGDGSSMDALPGTIAALMSR